MFYLKSKPEEGAVSLYTNRIIQGASASLIMLFLPIFLLERLGSVKNVLVFFIFYYGATFFVISIGAKLASIVSFKRSLFLSIPFGIFYFLSLYFFGRSPWLFMVLAIVFVNLFRMFYWIPFHSDFAEFTNKNERGKILALFQSTASFVSIFIPVLSGFIIKQYGFGVLFVIAVCVFTASVVPLLFIPKTYETFDFTYFETFRVLFHPRERRLLLSYMSDGAQDVVSIIVWPIFIWQILEGDFQSVGFITSGIILFTIILRLLLGNITDRFNKKKLLRFGSGLYALGWAAKAFVDSAFHIFAAGTYHSIAAIFMRTPFDTLMYEKAADLGHYVDEYTVLREMSLALGRIVMLIIILALIAFIPLNWMFFLAALFSLIVNLV